MAFTTQEQEIIKAGVRTGKSKEEISNALTRLRTGLGPVQKKTPVEQGGVLQDLSSGVSGVQGAIGRGLSTQEEAKQQVASGEIGPGAATLKIIGGGLRAGAESIGEGVLSVGKALLPQGVQSKIGEGATSFATSVAESEPVRKLVEKYQALSPEKKAIVDGTLGVAEGLTTMFGVGPAIKAFKTGISPVVSRAGSLFKKTVNTVDDVINEADNTLKSLLPKKVSPTTGEVISTNVPEINSKLDELISQGKTQEARQLAEETASQLTVREKYAGIRPDVKKRIEGKPDLMREYFDVAHTRNNIDTVPSAFEYGGDQARKAKEVLEEKLSETGGDIGNVRRKLGTVQAPRQSISDINQAFRDELGKLNLEIKAGQVVQKAGTQERLLSPGDLKALNDFYKELKITNQNPSLTNLIDVRTNFDGKIQFGKSQREVSNSVDPLARRMRSIIAQKAEGIVGKNAAKDIKRYSDFMDAYNDLKSYTDRNAGGEYLLRLVLSGRGGEARQIIQTIKEYTGIDLMDHATMMQIATEVIGNDAQKNLFRQEVTKAGLDVSRLLRGDPSGVVGTLFEKTMDRIMNPEKIFLEAAQ